MSVDTAAPAAEDIYLAAHIQDVREHGERSASAARAAAYDWTGWAHNLDRLIRTIPPVPGVTYLDECGEPIAVRLLANADIREVLTELLVDALNRADAIGQELRRHATLVAKHTSETVRTLDGPGPDGDA